MSALRRALWALQQSKKMKQLFLTVNWHSYSLYGIAIIRMRIHKHIITISHKTFHYRRFKRAKYKIFHFFDHVGPWNNSVVVPLLHGVVDMKRRGRRGDPQSFNLQLFSDIFLRWYGCRYTMDVAGLIIRVRSELNVLLTAEAAMALLAEGVQKNRVWTVVYKGKSGMLSFVRQLMALYSSVSIAWCFTHDRSSPGP